MDICSTMVSASLVEMWLMYSAICYVEVLLAVVRLVTAARSSTVAYSILANATDISVALFAVLVWYYPCREVFCPFLRSAYASMKCAWNNVQVFY